MILIENFSSPHPFKFDNGRTVPACSEERARELMLIATEQKITRKDGLTDIILDFFMSKEVRDEIDRLKNFDGIVIVPLPVMKALKDEYSTEEIREMPFRTIRMVDRVNKICSSTKFCI